MTLLVTCETKVAYNHIRLLLNLSHLSDEIDMFTHVVTTGDSQEPHDTIVRQS